MPYYVPEDEPDYPRIEGVPLMRDRDIERAVTYLSHSGVNKHGVISSFTMSGRVYVRFKANSRELVDPVLLRWNWI